MIRTILLTAAILLFVGCDADVFNTKKVETLKEQNQKLQQQIELKKEQNELELQKQKLSAEALLERERLKKQTELEKVKIEKQHQKELELIRQKTLLEEEKRKNELYRYALLLLALVLLIAAFFLYLYLKRKREDEITAYNDNLKKYFLFKENEMKMKMAEKILDTIKEGSLSDEDQKKLIGVLHSHTAQDIESGDIDLIEHK